VNIRGCFEKEDIIQALRGAGLKEHTTAPPIASPEKHLPVFGTSGSSSSYASATAPSRERQSQADGLAELSISQLKRVARERKVDISRCFEKADLVRALRPPSPPPSNASTLPCIRVLPRVRPAPPAGLPPGRRPSETSRETSPPIAVSRRSFDEDWDARYRRRSEELSDARERRESDRKLNDAVQNARRKTALPPRKSVTFSQETRRAPPAAYFQMPAQSYEQASPLEATG
jgi:hypothetical protein